ncbi:unnamed protein product [Allacma fusca]|uniref:Uncharacterized protein n=1 Tax=Allacma fusca TaxID=39272 RepID=A0A8J2J387_9HEXA|nr:unnamed protein product [Allacma fusca]
MFSYIFGNESNPDINGPLSASGNHEGTPLKRSDVNSNCIITETRSYMSEEWKDDPVPFRNMYNYRTGMVPVEIIPFTFVNPLKIEVTDNPSHKFRCHSGF